MMDLLRQCIEMFNDSFEREELPYEFVNSCDNYNIRPSKKSGKPDYDLPSKNYHRKINF